MEDMNSIKGEVIEILNEISDDELPEKYYLAHPEDGGLIMIQKGRAGYARLEPNEPVMAPILNMLLGINSSELLEKVMISKSMFIWPSESDE